MSILCGTDFSEASGRGVDAAAALARRMNLPLHVAHAVEASRADRDRALRDAVVAWAGTQLRAETERLRREEIQVESHLEDGPPDEVLLELAARLDPKLIVVAALGRREPGHYQLGSHAERLAQRSQVPVLVVRDAAPFTAWARGARPLRVLLAADLSLTSDTAARWLGALCQLGPCDVTAAHLYWPPAQFQKLGLHGVRSYVEPDPEVTRALERQFEARLHDAPFARSMRLHFEPHMGRIGDRIAALAAEQQADLIVIGSHARNRLERVLRGSVSHDALHCASVSVACVPGEEALRARKAPPPRTVLCATDFSAPGDAAVALAYAIAAEHGTVHLVHVTAEQLRRSTEPHDVFAPVTPENAPLRAQLAALVPDPGARRVATEVHVLASSDPAEAIAQAAERLDASIICLGTHGRTGVAKKLLGSVTEAVLRTTRRPVLLARAPIE